MKFDT